VPNKVDPLAEVGDQLTGGLWLSEYEGGLRIQMLAWLFEEEV
jgi:hypothetical protein